MHLKLNRRAALAAITGVSASALFSTSAAGVDRASRKDASLAKYVHPKVTWSYAELNEFIDVMHDDGLISLQTSLGLISPEAKIHKIDDPEATRTAIKTQLLWISSNVLAYPFRSEEKINYHNLVKWVGSQLNVDRWILDTQPTFVVERSIQEKLFADIWDKMTEQQRIELLAKVDHTKELKDHASVAALSGAGALAALSMTVHLAGFAFYTTMATVICTVAGFFGVTLPFAAYTTAATTVAFLAGPIGWALLAVAAAAGIAIAGRANPRKTAAAICQIHALKVAALQAADETDKEVFQALGDPVKRQLVGRWRLTAEEYSIELHLDSDGSFRAKSFKLEESKNSSDEIAWEGKGKWHVRDKVLTVARTHIWYRVYWSAEEGMLIDKRKIEDISPTNITLSNNMSLQRL